jgi:TfoX/Sxy family transcriptional regulator of competence genes
MAYNVQLAENLRMQLIPYGENIKEKKMFGGLSFLFNGKMCIGIIKDQLAVSILDNKMGHELNKTNVHPMDFTKKPMKEFVFVDVRPNEGINYWIKLGIEHANHKLSK